jgi:hypothetical protein
MFFYCAIIIVQERKRKSYWRLCGELERLCRRRLPSTKLSLDMQITRVLCYIVK